MSPINLCVILSRAIKLSSVIFECISGNLWRDAQALKRTVITLEGFPGPPFCLSLHSSIRKVFTAFHSKYLKRPSVITLKCLASGLASYGPIYSKQSYCWDSVQSLTLRKIPQLFSECLCSWKMRVFSHSLSDAGLPIRISDSHKYELLII